VGRLSHITKFPNSLKQNFWPLFVPFIFVVLSVPQALTEIATLSSTRAKPQGPFGSPTLWLTNWPRLRYIQTQPAFAHPFVPNPALVSLALASSAQQHRSLPGFLLLPPAAPGCLLSCDRYPTSIAPKCPATPYHHHHSTKQHSHHRRKRTQARARRSGFVRPPSRLAGLVVDVPWQRTTFRRSGPRRAFFCGRPRTTARLRSAMTPSSRATRLHSSRTHHLHPCWSCHRPSSPLQHLVYLFSNSLQTNETGTGGR